MANWPTVGATGAAKGLVGRWRRVAARAGFITTSMRLHHDRNLPADRPLLIPTVGDIAIFGHGRLAQALLDSGLTDELRLSVHPVLAGHGGLLFRDRAKTPLSLVAAKSLGTGEMPGSW